MQRRSSIKKQIKIHECKILIKFIFVILLIFDNKKVYIHMFAEHIITMHCKIEDV